MKIKSKVLCLVMTIALLVSTMGLTALSSEADTTMVHAVPTASTVLLDGTSVSFQAYNINDNNYFKLRDLAMALSGSAKQFEVYYNAALDTIEITTGAAYTAVGGELSQASDLSVYRAPLSTIALYINGTKTELASCNINGYNYVKLRDVAACIDFGVTYDETADAIRVDTSRGYVDPANPLIGSWGFRFTSGGDTYHSYLIFSEDGSIKQFLGVEVTTYYVNSSKFFSLVSEGIYDVYDYEIVSKDGQTTLTIDANQYGEMVRDGETTQTGPDAMVGLWLSKNEIFDGASGSDGAYFYFTKDGSVLVGIAYTGTYTVSGNTFTDTITSDGSPETSTFEIQEVDGATQMIVTGSSKDETVMMKEE